MKPTAEQKAYMKSLTKEFRSKLKRGVISKVKSRWIDDGYNWCVYCKNVKLESQFQKPYVDVRDRCISCKRAYNKEFKRKREVYQRVTLPIRASREDGEFIFVLSAPCGKSCIEHGANPKALRGRLKLVYIARVKKGTKTADVAKRLNQELTECSEAPLSEQECIALIEPHVERSAKIEYVEKGISYEDYLRGEANSLPLKYSPIKDDEARVQPSLDDLPSMAQLLSNDKND